MLLTIRITQQEIDLLNGSQQKTVSKKDNQILWKIMCCQELKKNHGIDGQSDSVSFHGC